MNSEKNVRTPFNILNLIIFKITKKKKTPKQKKNNNMTASYLELSILVTIQKIYHTYICIKNVRTFASSHVLSKLEKE